MHAASNDLLTEFASTRRQYVILLLITPTRTSEQNQAFNN